MTDDARPSPRERHGVRPPDPHPSGARPPAIPAELVPTHVALVMDGNGRWAKQRGLPRTEGHAAGEEALFDTVEGALDIGLKWLTVYAFSTENWRRPATTNRLAFELSIELKRTNSLLPHFPDQFLHSAKRSALSRRHTSSSLAF